MTSTASASNPRVGVAAMIRDAATGRLLVGQRLTSPGHGTWQSPGGHLSYGEAIFACAERETLEETGLAVKAARLAAVTNSVFADVGKHYITLFVLCDPVDPDAKPEVRIQSIACCAAVREGRRLFFGFLPHDMGCADRPWLTTHLGLGARQGQRLAVDGMVHHL